MLDAQDLSKPKFNVSNSNWQLGRGYNGIWNLQINLFIRKFKRESAILLEFECKVMFIIFASSTSM